MIKFHSAEKSVNEWGSESLLYSVLKYGAFVRLADEGKVLKRMVSKSMQIEKKLRGEKNCACIRKFLQQKKVPKRTSLRTDEQE